ncbi:putative deacetylase LmbE-like domain-containing protein [Peziza echinospora]|nr:putative deacetylase LmbE-like domain-containing protein [Peziza echinospora]
MKIDWLSLLPLPICIAALWFLAVLYGTACYSRHYPTHASILLVIAHPDDEAMFFAPTLLGLTPASLENNVQVLCLSIGDADGIGTVRKDELVASCERLGVPAPRVVSLDREGLKDGMGLTWDKELVAAVLKEQVGAMRWGSMRRGPEVVLTFDRGGVSGHSNHISVFEGARAWVDAQNQDIPEEKKTRLYTLTSIPLWRKYLSIIDFPFTHVFSKAAREERKGGNMVFISTWEGFSRAREAMTDAHVSQMRWFRWGWIWGSRYMVLNDLVLHKEDVSKHQSGKNKNNVKEL